MIEKFLSSWTNWLIIFAMIVIAIPVNYFFGETALLSFFLGCVASLVHLCKQGGVR